MKIQGITWATGLVILGVFVGLLAILYVRRQEFLRWWGTFPVQRGLAGITLSLKYLLLPTALVIAYGLVLYVPDQSKALLRALGAAFYFNTTKGMRGFEATALDAVICVLLNLLFLTVLWTYHQRALQEGLLKFRKAGLAPVVGTGISGLLLLSVASHVLIVGPLIASPDMALSLAGVSLMMFLVTLSLLRASFRPLRDWLLATAVVFVASLLSMVGLWSLAFSLWFFGSVALICLGFRQKDVSLGQVADFSLLVLATLTALFLSVYLRKAMHPSTGFDFGPALVLTIVWMLPSAVTVVLLKLPRPEGRLTWIVIGLSELLLVAGAYRFILKYNSTIALCSIPLLLSALAVVALNFRLTARFCRRQWLDRQRRRGAFVAMIAKGGAKDPGVATKKPQPALSSTKPRCNAVSRRMVSWFYCGAAFLGYATPWAIVLCFFLLAGAVARLSPTWLKYGSGYGASEVDVDDQFDAYLKEWMRLHAAGPVIVVSAAGGGIRAAQHVAATLAHADEFSGGAFGDRVIAVSAVSGGALGTLVWNAGRKEGILPHRMGPEGDPSFASGDIISRYFSIDFLSKSANLLVLHDLPLSAMPGVHVPAARDDALRSSWDEAWAEFKTDAAGHNTQNDFSSGFAMPVGRYGRDPIIVFNSTSAVDGRRAIRSNVGIAMPDTLALDPEDEAANAAYDSARFPLVSSVGYVCANSFTPSVAKADSHGAPCDPHGKYPNKIAITDGGYADNSGLMSTKEILGRLKKGGVNNDQIYVVYISSNPLEGHAYVDGDRFDSTSLAGTAFAPLSMMEAARAGRAQSALESIRPDLEPGHLIQWSLTQADPDAAVVDAVARHQVETSQSTPAGTSGAGISKSPAQGDHWYSQKKLPGAETQTDSSRIVSEGKLAKQLPPLGWTLDSSAVRGIDLLAIQHSFFFATGCNAKRKEDAEFCSAVEHSAKTSD
ncbi:hypothetical protein [Paraburkholderia aspalathi]|uniref:Patatin-like phospholipase n=1 Tax=Paraburkholderia aspalathi TaxID=1324617 RepID=A0A1I7EPL7_9BURK|nr:hypothetical protein [Paraburkholderia aspalathi]SFU25870.1 hypothetical protein SAMN05192563_10435 [Paraburkholderia aspalathi]